MGVTFPHGFHTSNPRQVSGVDIAVYTEGVFTAGCIVDSKTKDLSWTRRQRKNSA